MSTDRRLIEDYLPIQAISAEASREKSVRKGHISTLHLWWARRPLVACRAAVYGALVPASRFIPRNGPDNKKQSLGRANAAKFIKRLCRYPSDSKPEQKADIERAVKEAQRHILEAHAERLSSETGKKVTVEDIEEGHAPRPKVLDMFAGGGSIPLEALRLGCEAYALDINPVAHIIELCTLVYPQNYGKPDSTIPGMTGPKNVKGETTWGGLAKEVHYWGKLVLKKVRAEIGGLYPLIPDPEFLGKKPDMQTGIWQAHEKERIPSGYLVPVAYLWTRTVQCKNPSCGATVPLVRQTWLRRKKGDFVAAKIVTSKGAQHVRFDVRKGARESDLGFSPDAGSKRGNAICPCCGAVADIDYVKNEGQNHRIGMQLIATACTRPGESGKLYVAADGIPNAYPNDDAIQRRIDRLCEHTGLTTPAEPLPKIGTLGFRIQPYGFKTWADLFTSRQILCLLSFAAAVREAEHEMIDLPEDRRKAIVTLLAAMVDRLASFSSTQCVWLCIEGERTANTFGRHALPMVWDFSETAPFNEENAGWPMALDRVIPAIDSAYVSNPANVFRGSAVRLPLSEGSIDAIVTDPPYYDNVPYADISDFFYVWLRRTAGHIFPEHFASELTPKKSEAVAEPMRFDGSKEKARRAYEDMMAQSFKEAHRVLKPDGQMIVVYAHKTTLGWATLVDAMRMAGFIVTEAWPLDTEKPGRLRAQQSAALASSIFLVAAKRGSSTVGSYEVEVRSELDAIVRERVDSLWKMGITGADLVIAAVGAGLRAFTRFSRVEYANGEEVPAKHFLGEVETAVLENILLRLSKQAGASGQVNLAGVDPATRFYILWRFTYRSAELDGGEAIVFANGVHVELDGPGGLSTGSKAVLTKKKGKYSLRDFTERGDNEKLGMREEDGQSAPIIDALHRVLWLMEYNPARVSHFLMETWPNLEQMRLVAQVLTGPVLKGGETGQISPSKEMEALAKLTSNWRSLIEDASMTVLEKEERETGQKPIPFGKGVRK